MKRPTPPGHLRRHLPALLGTILTTACLLPPLPARSLPAECERVIEAHVVALDQPFFWNRYGAVQPQGMIYALRGDVVPLNSRGLVPGNVQLRPDKRPRPITLRMNVGDCLQVHFENLLNPAPVNPEQPATRSASVHVVGMQLVEGIADDGSWVGKNGSGVCQPGDGRTYTFYAEREGTFNLHSGVAFHGGPEDEGGTISAGLFGAVNVEPRGSEWYRSQVTQRDLRLATIGTMATGHPILDYDVVYPAGHPRAGLPILKMLQGNEIVHSDLTAIITGPDRGDFPEGTYPPVAVYPNREKPFREFTIIFHDEIGAVQAFPQFEDPVLVHTLHSVRDAFAINYGTAGVGTEILANRFGVGPVWDCTSCKYEEFFLSSWTVGDPAMVVDVPANAPCSPEGNLNGIPCDPAPGPKATKAFFPDDPSNVYHSYLNDHVKFRNLHAGIDDHHIFHLHAHQWLHTPDSDNSTYMDSQAIGQGSSYTYEITYDGSGNRNKTPGDSIFHCHFYPHFAQGMWSLWRVHDVFESGTPLDAGGRPAAGSRALPDGEIAAGTPIPALVPMPGYAMALLPQADVEIVNGQPVITGEGHAGYPFFVPGVAGHRVPHPPLDTPIDGGLPRHVLLGGESEEMHSRLDFHKHVLGAEAMEVPETGTPLELAAMAFHAAASHPSVTPEGDTAHFLVNDSPAAPGAPFADPCAGASRVLTYKAANIQMDVVLNKDGWHTPQQRFLSLWEDVDDYLWGNKPPEPMFFRGNTEDCIEYQHTNLVPGEYDLDDFEVRTPTDILGQHIHLVKFDVLASDGGGNGFNYEDGTFSPEDVQERIAAINAHGGMVMAGTGERQLLAAEPHPFFGDYGIPEWVGAQTTIQRWYVDDVLNLTGEDRTLRTVFTHDHFSPSTHQQAGLYCGLVVEPEGTVWRDPATGLIMGSRADGGPTSWRADILNPETDEGYREFMFEFGDMQMAYLPGNTGVPDPAKAINAPGREEVGLPFLYERPAECPGGVLPPCPEAISADDPGVMTVNYRSEPIATRIFDPVTLAQASGMAGDLSYALASSVTRANPNMNRQPEKYLPLTSRTLPGDPFTPVLECYEKDPVQVRILVGANEEEHTFHVHGIKWLFEPSDENSGFRDSQGMGISEHFEFEVPRMPDATTTQSDYLWKTGAAVDDLWSGTWGLMRVYRGVQPGLRTLPNNPDGRAPDVIGERVPNGSVCPQDAPVRTFDVTAVTAQDVLPGGTLIYNSRTTTVATIDGVNAGETHTGPLHDPTAILFVRTGDLDPSTGMLEPTVPVEPLILRAKAGECLHVVLRNQLPAEMPDLPGYSGLPNLIDHFNANQIRPSNRVGLHANLLTTDVALGDGVCVGTNPDRTIGPGETIEYEWYAGDLIDSPVTSGVELVPRPIEFGAVALSSSDPIKHSQKGAVGALIIEPADATWTEDVRSRAQATVRRWDENRRVYEKFREFVVILQNDINLRYGDGTAVPSLSVNEDSEESGQKAINYRTDPVWFRMGISPATTEEVSGTFDYAKVFSNQQVGGNPQTPVFKARVGDGVRFRVVHPGGHPQFHTFMVHGHVWEEEPFINGSTELGSNPLSQWEGSRPGLGPSSKFDGLLKHGAGGKFRVPGDYMYRDGAPWYTANGMWGILRVSQPRVGIGAGGWRGPRR